MLVPTAVEELHKSDVAFGQAPRQKTIVSVGAWLASGIPVEFESALRLVRKIDDFRSGGLHAEGHLILGDARLDLRVAEAGKRISVESRKIVEHLAPRGAVEPIGIFEIEQRIPAAAHQYALMVRRKKTTAP